MDKRFQIFVSSTFRDLQSERNGVVMSILEMGHFPTGMELFPAADSTPWDLIRSIISDSDYYVVIVGGMYGSVDDHGISYTEREFDLAVELGKPILGFLHETPSEIPIGKSELSEASRRKLEAFRQKIESLRHCNYWTSADNLRTKVILGLIHLIRTTPALGWIRSDQIDNTQLLTKMNDLRDKLEDTTHENERLKQLVRDHGPIEGVADDSDEVKIPIRIAYFDTPAVDQPFSWTFTWDWGSIFFLLGKRLLDGDRVDSIMDRLEAAISAKIADSPLRAEMELDAQKFRMPGREIKQRVQIDPNFTFELRVQFMAWDAITVMRSPVGNVWKLTPHGQRKYLARRARLKSDDTDDQQQ